MTLATQRERIKINNNKYEIGGDIDFSPESVLSLAGTRKLVVARRIDKKGEPATITQPTGFMPYPKAPPELARDADASAKQTHADAMDQHIEAIEAYNRETERHDGGMLAQPRIGYVEPVNSEDYLYLHHPEGGITSAIPYPYVGSPLYRLQFAEKIVE